MHNYLGLLSLSNAGSSSVLNYLGFQLFFLENRLSDEWVKWLLQVKDKANHGLLPEKRGYVKWWLYFPERVKVSAVWMSAVVAS